MKRVIYYFSGTGNNFYVAKRLSEIFKETDFIPITELLKNEKIDEKYEEAGFVMPSYYSHIPNIAKEIIEKLQLKNDIKLFLVVCSGVNRGHAMEDMRELFKEKNATINNEFYIIMPGTYILLYKPVPKWIEKILIKRADKKIERIAKIIIEGKKKTKLKRSIFFMFANKERQNRCISEFKNIAKNYTVSDKCTKCKMCINICPVENIYIKDSQIEFKDRCQQCMACIQWCPQKAIDYKNMAENKRRYHHPYVKYPELVNNKMLKGKEE